MTPLRCYFDWVGPHEHVPNGMLPGTESNRGTVSVGPNHKYRRHDETNLYYQAGFLSYLIGFDISHTIESIHTKHPADHGICLMEPVGGYQRLFSSTGGVDWPTTLSEPMLAAIRDRKIWVLWNYSLEGFQLRPHGWHNFAMCAMRHNIPLSQMIFLTGNTLETDTVAKEFCDRAKYSESFRSIIYGAPEDTFRHGLDVPPTSPVPDTWEYDFLSYNRRPHLHRMALLLELTRQDLLTHGAISFPNDQPLGDLGQLAISKYLSPDPAYPIALERLSSLPPLRVDQSDLNINYVTDNNDLPYRDSMFSLISETVYDTRSVFVTEKTFKAISQRHPFVVLGTHGHLAELHRLGYQTFHPHIDEWYDLEIDPRIRLQKVCKVVNNMCRLTNTQRKKLYDDIGPILEFNISHITNDNRPFDFIAIAATLRNIVQSVTVSRTLVSSASDYLATSDPSSSVIPDSNRVVLKQSYSLDFLSRDWLGEHNPSTLCGLRDRRLWLLLWIPCEGFDWTQPSHPLNLSVEGPTYIELLHNQLDNYDIPRDRVIVLSGASNMSELYAHLYPVAGVRWIDHWYELVSTNDDHTQIGSIGLPPITDLQALHPTRHFVVMCRVAKPVRIMIIAHLLGAGHLPMCHASLLSPWYVSDLAMWPGIGQWDTVLAELYKLSPLTLDTTDHNWQGHGPPTTNAPMVSDNYFVGMSGSTYLTDSYIHIVCETQWDVRTIFFSEKTWKPIVFCQPFIMVGTPGMLRELRRRGFLTFSPYIDESYDDITDDFARFSAICHELDRLAALSLPEMAAIRHALWDRCLFNRTCYEHINVCETNVLLSNMLRDTSCATST